jgi:hypothetical protein
MLRRRRRSKYRREENGCVRVRVCEEWRSVFVEEMYWYWRVRECDFKASIGWVGERERTTVVEG